MKVENQVAIELSNDELDVVAGGVDFLVDATRFSSNTLVVAQNTQSVLGGSSTTSSIGRQVIDTNAFHNITLGLEKSRNLEAVTERSRSTVFNRKTRRGGVFPSLVH